MPDFTLPGIDAQTALRLAVSGDALLVDLRNPQAVAASGQLVQGAERRDPFAFGHDDSLMKANRGVLITFCVHGHEVSQFACALMMIHGCDARYVTGGFESLKAAGAPLQPLVG
jgi:rhodanese-related sulfurtransferase